MLKKVRHEKCDPLCGGRDRLTQSSPFDVKVCPYNYHNLSPPVRRTSCCGVDSFGSMPYRTRPYRARTTPQPLVLVPLAEATNKREEDRLCPVERQNLHNSTLNEILLKKVRQEKCDPFLGKTVRYGPVDRQNFHNCIRCKFYSKKYNT